MKSTSLLALGGSLGLLVLLGLGCQSNQPTSEPTPAVQPSASTTVETPSSTSPVAINASTTVALPAIDNTWKTYENKALGFSFQWPTKGKYAPQWNEETVKTDDSRLKDGCLIVQPLLMHGEPAHVTLNGTEFCHTITIEGTAGTAHRSDDYLTKNGGQYILITFTKAYVDDASKFDTAAYGAHLDQIVSTFAYQK